MARKITVESVKALAQKMYDQGADFIVECMEDEEIQSAIDGGLTSKAKWIGYIKEYNSHVSDIKATGDYTDTTSTETTENIKEEITMDNKVNANTTSTTNTTKEDKNMDNTIVIEMVRANRIAVVPNEDGFIATFYRTHKMLTAVDSKDTTWTCPEDIKSKVSARESFRAFIIENASIWNIIWKPEDMRTENNMRKRTYTDDNAVYEDAQAMMMPDIQAMADKCKYQVKSWTLEPNAIVPMTHTGNGTDLSKMGITNGKYNKSGNWAWANVTILCKLTISVNDAEYGVVIPMEYQVVSGQLKKDKINITRFNQNITDTLVALGIITEEKPDNNKGSEKVKTEKSSKTTPTADAEIPKEVPTEKKRVRKSKATANAQ